jgi:hypothetical protein
LEYFAEHDTLRYDRVDIVAYSFGSVVAIDALYPLADIPGPRFEQIDTLVTIGCPFDIIRTYWPEYFDRRWHRVGVPRRWLNIYSPIDVFGSNFLDVEGSEIGVRLQDGTTLRPHSEAWHVISEDRKVSPIQVLLMVGIKAHAMYWAPSFEQEDTVFAPVMRHLYAGHPLLV